MNNENYTNFPEIWTDIGFDQSKNIFYKVNHQDASWKKLFNLPAFESADKIFVVDQESHSHKYIDQDNRIHAWDSTISNHPRIYTYLFWFDWVKEIESHMQLAKKILPVDNKHCNILVDSLLGTIFDRPHKQFVLKNIQSSESDNFITGACIPQCEGLPDGYVSGGEHETGDRVIVYNEYQQANASCFIPYKIYNDTWYSLICETRGTGDKLFFTEKLAKPLISGRVFVLFGQYKQLHYLKTLGYKTFDGIIDESYDLEPDDELRYKKAWAQIEFLMSQNPIEIYQECKSVLEHNRYIIKNTNWMDILIKDMYEKSVNMG